MASATAMWPRRVGLFQISSRPPVIANALISIQSWKRGPAAPRLVIRSSARATSAPAMLRYLRAPPTSSQSIARHAAMMNFSNGRFYSRCPSSCDGRNTCVRALSCPSCAGRRSKSLCSHRPPRPATCPSRRVPAPSEPAPNPSARLTSALHRAWAKATCARIRGASARILPN
jgi:hypothetical protein